MNRLDTAMRVACRDPELDLVTRLLILELVELRQNAWNLNENILAYYRQKLAQAKQFFKHCYPVMFPLMFRFPTADLGLGSCVADPGCLSRI